MGKNGRAVKRSPACLRTKMPKFEIHYHATAKALKFTVPKKWLAKPLLAVVEFYCDEYFNKKNPDTPIQATKIGVNRDDADGKSIAVETEIAKVCEMYIKHLHLCDLEVAREPAAAPAVEEAPAPAPAPAEEAPAAEEAAPAEEAANKTEEPKDKKPKQTHQAPIKAGEVVAKALLVSDIDMSEWPEPGPKPLVKCKYSSSCDLVGEDPEHMRKFSHSCWYIHKGGTGVNGKGVKIDVNPGTRYPIARGCNCAFGEEATAKHKYYFPHPALSLADQALDETVDALDGQVMAELDAEPVSLVALDGEPTDEQMEAAMEAKSAAQAAMGEGNFEEAIKQFSVTLQTMQSALVLANRATAYVKMKMPRAALADCEAAIAKNPDSAKSYKVAGKALCLMGKFDEAFKKLCTGNNIDGDDASFELQQQLKARQARIAKNQSILQARIEAEE